jgi:hypothetical protein
MSTRITEAQVEAAAKAAYAVRAKCYDFVFAWEQTCEARKQHYRDEARAALAAALFTEPGVAALHYECASAGCERPATVHFIRADVGSYYCRECYMRIQAIPAGRQALESDNG